MTPLLGTWSQCNKMQPLFASVLSSGAICIYKADVSWVLHAHACWSGKHISVSSELACSMLNAVWKAAVITPSACIKLRRESHWILTMRPWCSPPGRPWLLQLRGAQVRPGWPSVGRMVGGLFKRAVGGVPLPSWQADLHCHCNTTVNCHIIEGDGVLVRPALRHWLPPLPRHRSCHRRGVLLGCGAAPPA